MPVTGAPAARTRPRPRHGLRPQPRPSARRAPGRGAAPAPRNSGWSRSASAGPQLQAIESYIPGAFDGWHPKSVITLANGQVWQISDDSARRIYRTNPKVTIRRGALGSFFLDVEGDNSAPRVRRLQ